MSDVVPKFDYRVVGENNLEILRPLWEKLRAHHSPLLSRFPGEMPPFVFGPRKQEILAKASPGKIRIKLVSIASDGADVARCVTPHQYYHFGSPSGSSRLPLFPSGAVL